MSLLRVNDLSLSIGNKRILKDISFELDAGKVLGLIGESGSGKSMTAASIVNLLPEGAKREGRIYFDEEELSAKSEEEMCDLRGDEIGMIFQEPMSALNPLMNIGDQVAEAIMLHRDISKKRAWEAAALMLERAGLPPKRFPMSRYPHELSGGQRQRVVIAIAIALKPKLLIADEPTTALDVTTQARILELLKALVKEENIALILITHDLAVVDNIADHVAIMKDGEIVEQGGREDVFKTLAHPYSRALFKASSHQPSRQNEAGDEPILELSNLRRSYRIAPKGFFGKPGYFEAVKGVSFKLHQGETLGLVGESGCGKSTLTRAILGLDPIDEGSIAMNGEILKKDVPMPLRLRRNIQVVFQDPYGSFNPRHKVGRIISEPYHLLEAPPKGATREEEIAESLRRVGLSPDDAGKYIHEFSGGERQRIAIARALIIRPQIIILDEAVSALDVEVRAQILDLLAGLADQFGLAYLFISHDLSVVRRISDRILVMRAGAFVERGTPDEIFNHPKHEYTRKLIAATPVIKTVKAA